MKKDFYIILIFILLGILLTSCTKEKSNVLSNVDQIRLTKLVYNRVVEKEENIDMISVSQNEKFSNNIFFSKIIIHSSFYITSKIDFEMSPFFGEEAIDAEIDTVIALIGFEDTKGKEMSIKSHIIIFRYNDIIYGFLSPVSTEKTSIDESDILEFGSYMFLTKNAIVKYYDNEDILYHFSFEVKGFGFKVYTTKGVNSTVLNEYEITTLNETYILLDSTITQSIIEDSFVEEMNATAIVVDVDKENMIIYVVSEKLKDLKLIYYRNSIVDMNNNFYSIDEIKIGDLVEFKYYKRYLNYSPAQIYTDYLYIIT